MKRLFILALFLISHYQGTAQTISGKLTAHAGQQISITGFDYIKASELANTTADSLGNFTLHYPKDYKGMAVLNTQDRSSLIIALTEKNIQLKGTHLKEVDSLQFINSPNNVQFFNFATQNIENNQAYQAWNYLQPLYAKGTLKQYKSVLENINQELKRIDNADAKVLQSMSKDRYVSWFLPIQLLVNRMPATASTYQKRLPKDIAEFRTIDFANPNFKTSGLFIPLLEGHYMLLENMGQPLDSVYVQMNTSTDYIIENLKNNQELLNMVTAHLFNYFEKRSLFPASEYLAVKVLNEKSCVLNTDLSKKLESYRAMKKGKTAPDMVFEQSFFAKPEQAVKKLSDFKSKYTLVVFGASWCPACKEEIPLIANYYNKWKAKGVEVVFISLEEDRKSFTDFAASFPFPSYNDLKKWDSTIVKDYYVFGTPTLFLLNDKREIVLRPTSVDQVNAWVKTYLGE